MDGQRNTFGWPCWVSPPSRTSPQVTRFLISQIFFIQLILRTYLIPNLSDSEPIWFQTYLIPGLSDFENYLIPDLSESTPTRFWTYLIPDLSDNELHWDIEPIRYQLWGLFGVELYCIPYYLPSLQSWAGRQPLLPFPVAKLAIKQVNPGPLFPSQLAMTTNPL